MGFGLPSWSDVKKAAAVVAPAIALPAIVGAKVVGAVAPRVISAAPKALPFIAPAITVPALLGDKVLGFAANRFNNGSPAPAPVAQSGGARFAAFDSLKVPTLHPFLRTPAPSPVTTITSSPLVNGGGGGGGTGGGYTLPDGTVVDTAAAPTSLVGKFNALSTPMKLGLVALVGGGIYLGVKHFGGAHEGHAPKSAQSHHA